MKKQLLIISVMIVTVGIFVSCSANSSSETVSTASAVNESTEAVTDSKENIVITESITEPTAKKFEETTSVNYPDNDVELSTTDFVATTTVVNSTTANSTTRHKADKKASVDGDGWINKWY